MKKFKFEISAESKDQAQALLIKQFATINIKKQIETINTQIADHSLLLKQVMKHNELELNNVKDIFAQVINTADKLINKFSLKTRVSSQSRIDMYTDLYFEMDVKHKSVFSERLETTYKNVWVKPSYDTESIPNIPIYKYTLKGFYFDCHDIKRIETDMTPTGIIEGLTQWISIKKIAEQNDIFKVENGLR